MSNTRGTAAIAHWDVPDCGNSEFFINLGTNAHLDEAYGGYCVFAQVEDDASFAIVDAIAARSAEAADGLLEPTAKHVDTAGNFFKLKQAQEAEASSTRRHRRFTMTTSYQRKGCIPDGDYLGV